MSITWRGALVNFAPNGNADTGNNEFVWLGNITDMEGMEAFLSTDEEVKWDKDNGCIYKIYTMSEISE